MNRKQILNIIDKAEKDITAAPDGILRATDHRSKPQFFIRNGSSDVNGRYLKKDEIELAAKLAQKEYAQLVLKEARKQLKNIDTYLEKEDPDFARKIWAEFNPLKKKIIQPYEVTDEEFTEQWKAVKYNGNNIQFDKNFDWFTKSGIHVRSKNEKIIADILDENNIPYRYEYPYSFMVSDEFGIPTTEIYYPDFTVLNKRTRKEFIWEHFGMMDYEKYRRQFYSRMETFNAYGFFIGENMIATFSDNLIYLRKQHCQKIIDRYLK